MTEKPEYEELEKRIREMEAEIAKKDQMIQRRDTLLAALDTGLSVINPDKTIDWVNEKTRRMFPGKELVGKHCHVCYQSSSEPCDPCSTTHCFETGDICRMDRFYPVLNKWYHVISHPIQDAEGRVVRVLEGFRDITERKLAEEKIQTNTRQLIEKQNQLIKNEALFRGLFDHMTSGSAIYQVINDGSKGSDYIIKGFNNTSLRIEGKTADQVIGKSLFDLRPHIDSYGLIPVMKEVWETGKPAQFPAKIYHDEEFSNYYENYIFKIPSGEVVTIYNDVTEEKMAEKATRDNERKLHDLLHMIQAGVAVHDAATTEIKLINSAAKKILGMSDEELMGKSAEDPEWEFIDENGRILAVGEYPVNIVKRTREPVKDLVMGIGSTTRTEPVWVLCNAEPFFDDKGKMVEIIVSSMDITDLKKAQEQLKERDRQLLQAQKMESIGTLAGGIAHDFNNILTSILGYTELSLDDVSKDSMIEENLKEVYAAGKRAKDLVSQILTFARQSEEEVKPVRVAPIAGEVLKLIRSSIPTTIEIKQNLESESLIMGNDTQVHQILMNLCTNAAHAMEEEGGVLSVRLEDLSVQSGDGNGLGTGDYLKITVSDSGVGIAPEILESVFEPYFTTKGVGEGTGMGLAVVQGIVKGYSGRISVESVVGEGTVFTIYLPIIGKCKTCSISESMAIPTGTERVLFVDDEAAIAKMGGLVLTQLGYNASTRTSSIEALELFRSKPDDFDLVITDMTMPNMTGDKLAVELMKIRPDIPVILCTGFSKKINEEKISRIGIKAVVYKPIVRNELAKIIRKALDNAKASDH